jgi:hypothetical protein
MRWVVALAVLLASGTARADEMPKGRMAAAFGIRNGTEALGSDFGLGVLYGVQAAWEPMPDGSRIGYAIQWEVLRGDFGNDPAAITGGLEILEMSLGARLRFAPQDPARTLFLGGGGSLLRSNAPLPPDEKRNYAGGFAGLGLEQLVYRRALLTLEVRYGLIGNGPGSLSVVLGVGFGV